MYALGEVAELAEVAEVAEMAEVAEAWQRAGAVAGWFDLVTDLLSVIWVPEAHIDHSRNPDQGNAAFSGVRGVPLGLRRGSQSHE